MNNKKQSILVVDDEAGLRDLLNFELINAGYEVQTGVDGIDALTKFKQSKFDLVLTDIMMPRMNGIELLEEVKRLDPYIEVIITTGYGQVESAVNAMKKGAYDFIQKPYSLHEILAVVEKAIEKRSIRESCDAAIEASRAKSEFLSMVSHEIRTPLNAMIGMTELIGETALTSEQTQYLAILKKSSDSLLGLVNDVLDLSKIECGKVELEKLPFNPKILCLGLMDVMKLRASQKKLTLQFECPSEPPYVVGDENRVRQVIMNLLGNALKFTEKGTVTLRLEFQAYPSDVSQILLRFTVKDTGIGIPADKFSIIFEPFKQADSSTTRKYGGTGLGLSISKQLVELMGGVMRVESRENEGARFDFEIPFKVHAAGPQKDSRTEPHYRADTKSAPKILIVEDIEDNRTLFHWYLRNSGILIEDVSHSQDALPKAVSGFYQAILVDLNMPDKSGISLIREIRKYEQSNKKNPVPIIVITADALKETFEEVMASGADAFLLKPFKKSELIFSLSKFIPQSENIADSV